MKPDTKLDEVLKDRFSGFSPEAPDVWSGISQGLQTATTITGSAPAASGIKALSLAAKVWLGTGVVALVAGGIWVTSYLNNDSVPSSRDVIVQAPVTNSDSEEQLDSKANDQTVLNAEQETAPAASQASNTIHKKPVKPIAEKSTLETTGKSESPEITETRKQIVTPTQTSIPVVPQSTPGEKKETSKPVKPAPAKESEPVNNQTVWTAEPRIPNIFTPDNDGLNDQFVIEIDEATSYAIKIINLKGSIVFESSSLNEHWNGINRNTGEACEAGWYFYTVKYQQHGGETQVKNGKVKLVR